MALLKARRIRMKPLRLPGPLMAVVLLLGLLAGMLPVANTLWAEVLTVSGSVETGEWMFSETPSETPTETATPTPTAHAQAGTTLEAYKTVETRWPEGGDGSTFIVFGQICVLNYGDRPTVGLRIVDQVEVKPKRKNWQALDGATLEILPNVQLEPGEVRCFDYELSVRYLPETAYRNTARVTILNHSGWLPGGKQCPGPDPCPFGPEPKVEFSPPDSGNLIPGPIQPQPGDEGVPIAPPEVRWPGVPTASPTPTASETATPTPTASEAPTSTPTLPPAPTSSPTPTASETATPLPTWTPTPSPGVRPSPNP